MFLTNLSRSTLLSTFALVNYEKPINTAEDVVASGLKVYAYDGALLSSAIRDSDRAVYRSVFLGQMT